MGSIYIAADTKLNRMVAIKALLDELTRDDLKRKRFIQEARTAAALDQLCRGFRKHRQLGFG